MSFEPQKFFVGLTDFFTILLPGGFIVYLATTLIDPRDLPVNNLQRLEIPVWAAFLVMSYLCGHFVFLIASLLDGPYDSIRNRTLNKQVSVLARNGKLLPRAGRAIIRKIFKNECDIAVNRVGKIKRQLLDTVQAGNSMNNFQWCKAWLTKESPDSMAVVQRFEADSKFFRCFSIILAAIIISLPFQSGIAAGTKLLVAALCFGLIPLALWRYADQRLKATNQAYWCVIALTARDSTFRLHKKRAHKTLTHAGGIVFQKVGDKAEYLILETAKEAGKWVLPKGHIEEGETPWETAVREVLEETGVWARISDRVGLEPYSYDADGERVTVQYFLMEFAARDFPVDKNREIQWLPFEDARDKLQHSESKYQLAFAEGRRKKLVEAGSVAVP